MSTDDTKREKNGQNFDKIVNTSPWKIMEPIKKEIIIGMILAALSVICNVLFIFFIICALDEYIKFESISNFWYYSIVITAFLGFIFLGLGYRASHLGVFKLEVILREKILSHMAKIPLGILNQLGTGAINKILVEDVKSLHVFVADGTPLYAKAFVASAVMILAMFFLNISLAIIAIIFIFLAFGIFIYIFKKSENSHIEYHKAQEEVSSSIIEFIQAMPIVRTFDGGSASFSRFEKSINRFAYWLTDWYLNFGRVGRIGLIVINPIIFLLFLAWVGAFFKYHEWLSFHEWTGILLFGTALVDSVFFLVSLEHLIMRAKISANTINEILETKPLDIAKEPKTPSNLDIYFKNVSFCYPNRDELALDNINADIKEGQWVAVVGSSGSGKSTMAKLLPRFFDVSSGEILIGGVDIKDIEPNLLMKTISFVFQDNFLFSGTIRENIALGNESASDEDIYSAAKAAQIHDFIISLPKGYATNVNERGVSLSGGQRQRITIARAILQNRPILILDEATAFADPENEYLLMKAMFELMKGKTVFMVAHRLQTIQNADKILVLDSGKCVAQGTHEELLKDDKTYQDLWKAYESAKDWQVGKTAKKTAKKPVEREA